MAAWRLAMALLVLLPLSLPLPAVELPLATDLSRDAREALQLRKPILLFFSDPTCEYCHVVEELYLEPMYASGLYDDKLIIRVIRIESANPLRDFTGSRTDHQAFARRQDAGFAPLVRFYDHTGRELTEELRGFTGPDFYGGYLEQKIDAAQNRFRSRFTD